MATVKNLVRKSLLAYPNLYGNRTDVLHHALCVIGNDMSWKNGQVVSKEVLKPKVIVPLDQQIAVYEKHGPEVLAYFMEHDYPRIVSMLSIVENVGELSNHVGPLSESYGKFLQSDVYPQHRTSLLMTMPDDVTPDWREACEYMRDFAGARGWKF